MPDIAAHDLRGRTVLVTGAGRGLGRALVMRLLHAGANVAGCARSDADLASLAREAEDAPLLAFHADVSDARQMQQFADAALARWGRIDGLVINASILDRRAPLRDIDPHEWRDVIDVNLNGAFNAWRAVARSMHGAGEGSIIAVSSGAADRPRREWGAYAVSKHALEAFAQNLALEERDAGVRVNVVDPGAMRTAMRQAAYPDEDPATLPDPAEHLDLYLWLLGPASAGVTGQRFVARDWRPPA